MKTIPTVSCVKCLVESLWKKWESWGVNFNCKFSCMENDKLRRIWMKGLKMFWCLNGISEL